MTGINYRAENTKAFGAHVVKKIGVETGVAGRAIEHVEKWSCKVDIIVHASQVQAAAEDMRRLKSEHRGQACAQSTRHVRGEDWVQLGAVM